MTDTTREGEATPAPRARTDGLVVREVADELLVYDLATHKAVCLNRTAALVWKACDGSRTVGEVARALGGESGGRVPSEVVWLALAQLEQDGLLGGRVSRPPTLAGMSRRELMRRAGRAAVVALPVVASILAPTAAQAGSPCNSGAPCTTNADCASGCTQGCQGNVCL